jgi:hypothetical protein
MGPNEKQKIEIEKFHWDPLPPLNQALAPHCSDFLGTALRRNCSFARFFSSLLDYLNRLGLKRLAIRKEPCGAAACARAGPMRDRLARIPKLSS